MTRTHARTITGTGSVKITGTVTGTVIGTGTVTYTVIGAGAGKVSGTDIIMKAVFKCAPKPCPLT